MDDHRGQVDSLLEKIMSHLAQMQEAQSAIHQQQTRVLLYIGHAQAEDRILLQELLKATHRGGRSAGQASYRPVNLHKTRMCSSPSLRAWCQHVSGPKKSGHPPETATPSSKGHPGPARPNP